MQLRITVVLVAKITIQLILEGGFLGAYNEGKSRRSFYGLFRKIPSENNSVRRVRKNMRDVAVGEGS